MAFSTIIFMFYEVEDGSPAVDVHASETVCMVGINRY